MQTTRDSQQSLVRRLAAPATLDAQAVTDRLAGGRFGRELRTFQVRDLGELLALDHGANFSVPGAGKTSVTLAAYEAEHLAARVERLLVIAPLSAFAGWEEEAAEWFTPALEVARVGREPLGDAELALVNYQRLPYDFQALATWVTARRTMVVLDEAHRMKSGWAGVWGSACLNLAYLAARRDILSGTPAPNHPRDLVALFDFLWPGQAQRRILPGDTLVARPPADAGSRIAQSIEPLFVRTTKGELGLPDVTHRVIEVELEPLHRAIYDALRSQYAGSFVVNWRDQLDLSSMGRIVMYLLEAATNPRLLTAGSLQDADPDIFRHPPLAPAPGSRLAELLERYHEHETPGKFQQLALLVEENARCGRKTLVWTNFVRNLLTLRRMFAKYEPAIIHGAVPPFAQRPGDVNREDEIARFRKDPDCMLLLANPAAMSEGISLHRECHEAIYLDRTFNAGQYLQSVDRIHRLGLGPDVVTRVTFLISKGTVDETVDRRVQAKAEMLADILADEYLVAAALPNDEDYGAPIEADDEDLTALFAHLRGDPEPPRDHDDQQDG